MKKFFSTVVLAAAAIFGLSNCGGGGDGSPQTIDVIEFATGTKWFMFGGKGGQQTLYITGSGKWQTKSDDEVLGLTFKSAVGHPSNDDGGTCNYTVTRDDEGKLISGTIRMSYDNVTDEDVANYFGFEIGDDDEEGGNGQGGNADEGEDEDENEGEGGSFDSSILDIYVDFTTGEWNEVGNEENKGVFWVHRQGA